jgi:hypothetical protein
MDCTALPQFKIKFSDNNETYTAFCDEVAETSWTPEMKACLLGQVAYDRKHNLNEDITNPFTIGDLVTAFNDGVECMTVMLEDCSKKGEKHLFPWKLPTFDIKSVEAEAT